MRAYVFTCGLVLMRALLSLAMIAGLTAFLGIALMRLACFAAEECFLFVHTRRRRRDRWVSIIKWMLVKGTVRALPHRFTRVFNYMRTRGGQFTGYRGAFSNARLTRIERGVLDVALHTNGGITAADDALESPSTQLRPARRKQSFSGSITLWEGRRKEACWHRHDRHTGSLAPPRKSEYAISTFVRELNLGASDEDLM
jgi:hypothetical protein